MTFLGRATRCRGERRCTARWRFDPPVLYAGTQNRLDPALVVQQSMRYRGLASLGEVSVLGLGCSRLGSLTASRTRRESLSLIAAAVNAGITLFDTADIYAQGGSERILGEALKSVDAKIVTKAGQRFPFRREVLLPLRGMATRFLAHSSHARAAAIAARAKPLSRNYTPEYLRRSLLDSLRRLQREQADIFLLHSPSPADLADGEALDCLNALKQEGSQDASAFRATIKRRWRLSLPTSALKQLRRRLVQTVKTCSFT